MQLQLYHDAIWVYKKAIDFRKSIDGLSALVVSELRKLPQEGLYLFFNRQRDKVKCLSWHQNGFLLLYKRLERGRFQFRFNEPTGAAMITLDELGWLLAGLEWQSMRDWGKLNYEKFQ